MPIPRPRVLGALCLATLCLACAGSGPVLPPTPASEAFVYEPIVSRPPVAAPNGMVVASNMLASQVGRNVLRAGGNAVDAAIATGFAMAVVHPSAGNIGGGGFMIIRFPDGWATAIDFREKAPLAAHPEMFLDENGEYSYRIHHDSHLSVGVPGTVAGLALAHQRYGTAGWSSLIGPAIDLAAEGFTLTRSLAHWNGLLAENYSHYPATVAAFSREGDLYEAGEVWRQPDLASTLARIAENGRDGFYAGETARLLVAEMERGGGIITAEDLARYEALEREPIRGTFRGYEVISMPPPSSGGIALVEMLNILEGYELGAMEHNSAEYVHHLAEAMRAAFRDRARWVADSDFADVPVERLTSKAYARRLRGQIDDSRAGTSAPEQIEVAPESEETTHFSVVDSDGMAVAVTYTLEQGYGSRIVVPGAGFLLNNEMGDFNGKPGLTTELGLIGTEPNVARPEQRMLSSMTPSILTRDGDLVAVVGSPGGRTIINTVLQVLLNVMVFEMDIQAAVDARRIHHQWLPDRLYLEEGGFTPETVAGLEAMGHAAQRRSSQGRANSIMIDAASGARLGAPDARAPDSGAAGH